jgi:hypothetical protein
MWRGVRGGVRGEIRGIKYVVCEGMDDVCRCWNEENGFVARLVASCAVLWCLVSTLRRHVEPVKTRQNIRRGAHTCSILPSNSLDNRTSNHMLHIPSTHPQLPLLTRLTRLTHILLRALLSKHIRNPLTTAILPHPRTRSQQVPDLIVLS